MIRQPIFSAIDLLRVKKYGNNYPSRDGIVLLKSECCRLFKEAFPLDATDLFVVLGMRQKYRGFLKGYKKKTLADYKELLREIDGIYANGRRVIESNLDFLCRGLS